MKSRQFLVEQIDLLQDFIKHNFGLSVKIGAELEFYLKSDSQKEADEIINDLSLKGLTLEKEKGWGQYECVFGYEESLGELVNQISKVKAMIKLAAIQHESTAIFKAKPYLDDYGSALHLHLSIYDKDGSNVFKSATVTETDEIGKTIAGIIDISLEAVYLLCKTSQDYLRFAPKFLAPTHVAWGANNRTTIVRIPLSTIPYKRIEFRLPSSSSNPGMAIYVLLIGAIHGLSNNLILPPQVHGNAFDDVYKLTPLPENLSIAKNIFEKKGKILHYIERISPKLILDNFYD